MLIKRICGIVLMLTIAATASGQVSGDTIFLDLAGVLDFSTKNNPNIRNAELDVFMAKKKIMETTAMGLPHISSKMDYSYMITLPSEIEQFSNLGQLGSWMYGVNQVLHYNVDSTWFLTEKPDTKITAPDDMKWDLTLDLSASQLIFSGKYIVGLQTSKVYSSMMQQMLEKTKTDVAESVKNAYYTALIMKENKRITDSTYANMLNILSDMEGLYEAGLIAKSDINQMQINVSSLKNAANALGRQYSLSLDALRIQIGADVSDLIFPDGNIYSFITTASLEVLSLKTYSSEKYPDYMLLETQNKLMQLNLKLNKSEFLPDIAAYYNHHETFNENSFSFTPPDLFGVSLSFPLFSSGERLAKVSQAKLQLAQARNTLNYASKGIALSFSAAKTNFINALEKFNTNKNNLGFAESIYNEYLIRYKEGMISGMELTQAQNQYLQIQSAYFMSLLELLNAKSKFERF